MSVEDGLAELSGIRLCARPGCTRTHNPGQGVRTDIAGVKTLTCYGACQHWALSEALRRATVYEASS